MKTFVGALLLLAAFGLVGCAHSRNESETLVDGERVRVPIEIRKGTASREQAEAWTRSLFADPDKQSVMEVDELDLNQDGKKELLLADQSSAGATGNNMHLAFERTPKGYHFIGSLGYKSIDAIPGDATHGPFIFTSWHMGGGETGVQLTQWDTSGFHCLAGATVLEDNAETEHGSTSLVDASGEDQAALNLLKRMFFTNARP